MQYKYFFTLIISFVVLACTQRQTSLGQKEYLKDLVSDTSVQFARRFSIAENDHVKIIYLFGNKDIKDTTALFIFPKDSSIALTPDKKTFIIKGSCHRIASLSSVYTSMLYELNELSHVIAVDNIDYYNNDSVKKMFANKKLVELNRNVQMDIEKAIQLSPDIIFTFGMVGSKDVANEKITRAGIPIVVTLDHLEKTPLARAEWIKFFGAFTGKRNKADSLFDQVKKHYRELKELAASSRIRPTVFTEIKYGEIWYAPGGNSYAASFIKDANANYVWQADSSTGSLHLGFEEVFIKAKDADFWLNQSLVKSKAELLALESRYAEFKAFKTGNLYNNIKHSNEKGYSDYWETGIIFPDRVLSDLVNIFHPELAPQIKNDLYYYRKLE
jgi:iron complex transport system substrate-binding protein